jgi:hypothetical protein
MVAVRISPFGGMVPAVDDRLLASHSAALAQDTWTYPGTLKGTPKLKELYDLSNLQSRKVYRLPNNYVDSVHISDSTWVEFESADTEIIRSQVIDDSFDRYYWASPLDAPRYMTLAQLKAAAPTTTGAYFIGIPAPGNISAVASGGSSSTLKAVSYVQTFVSAYGEEGPPSTPVTLNGVKIDATVTVTLHAADPGDLGTNRNLTKSRIYRTITSTSGATTYFFVTEVPIATTTYADSATDAVIGFNAQISSTTWTAPPADLSGWVSLGNGIVAGFRSNEIWFCEPFRMHAWPAQYTLVVEYPIVGLGVQNQQLVVCTEGFTYTVTGIAPASMSLNKIAGLTPCTSRGSIVSATEGVYFSTPAGLALISSAGLVVATKELIRKEKWTELVATSTLRAAQVGGGYYAFGQAILGVFQDDAFQEDAVQQEDFGGALKGILVDTTNKFVAFNLLSSDIPVDNVMVDAWSNEVFIILDGKVMWLDIGDTQQPRVAYTWRSKIFQIAVKRSLQAAKVYFTVPPGSPALNPVQNMAQVQTLAADQYGLFRVYADGRLVMTRELRTSGELMRLPSGFKADFWQFELEARVEIDNIQVASSVEELQTV